MELSWRKRYSHYLNFLPNTFSWSFLYSSFPYCFAAFMNLKNVFCVLWRLINNRFIISHYDSILVLRAPRFFWSRGFWNHPLVRCATILIFRSCALKISNFVSFVFSVYFLEVYELFFAFLLNKQRQTVYCRLFFTASLILVQLTRDRGPWERVCLRVCAWDLGRSCVELHYGIVLGAPLFLLLDITKLRGKLGQKSFRKTVP